MTKQADTGDRIEPGLAGELRAEAVGGAFGFGGAGLMAEVPVGDLVPGKQREEVAVEVASWAG